VKLHSRAHLLQPRLRIASNRLRAGPSMPLVVWAPCRRPCFIWLPACSIATWPCACCVASSTAFMFSHSPCIPSVPRAPSRPSTFSKSPPHYHHPPPPRPFHQRKTIITSIPPPSPPHRLSLLAASLQNHRSPPAPPILSHLSKSRLQYTACIFARINSIDLLIASSDASAAGARGRDGANGPPLS